MKCINTIGTHNGIFHCDEVLGCSMLRLIYPKAEIIRSRDDNVLAKCDIVIDVGGKYEPDNYLFDHHQRGFEHTGSSILPNKKWKVKLSSAGLVYCHFGKLILKSIDSELSDDELEAVYDKVYEGFVQEIDGIDNGIPISNGEENYWISTNLSSRVARMNKSWTVKDTEFDETKAFNSAMEVVTKEFIERVRNFITEWLPAKIIVQSSIESRFQVDPSGEIMELKTSCPWKAHFFNLEKELNIVSQIKFVIFPNESGWRVQAVSVNETSFELRKPLHADWRGFRNKEVSEIAGIEGCIFVHNTGFIGGNLTRDGALQMAIKTLKS